MIRVMSTWKMTAEALSLETGGVVHDGRVWSHVWLEFKLRATCVPQDWLDIDGAETQAVSFYLEPFQEYSGSSTESGQHRGDSARRLARTSQPEIA